MQQRLILRGILGAVTLLIVMLGAVVIWLWTQSPLTLLRAQPEIPEIVGLLPRTTTAMVALDAPVERLQDLFQTAAFPSRRRATRRLQSQLLSSEGPGILGRLFTAADLDFSREIQPWLGDEVIWALIPVDDRTSDQPTPAMGSVLVLSTRDYDRSLLFLNLLWQRQELSGVPLQISTYKGVQVVTVPLGEGEQQGSLSGAAFTEGYIIFADHLQVLQQAIDAWQMPQFSLKSTPAYQTTLPQFQDPRVGWVYLQLRDPMVASDSDAAVLRTLGFSLRPSFKGVILETQALWSLPDARSIIPSFSEKPSSLIEQLPHTTMALLSGQHLTSLWQTLKIMEPIAGVDLAKTLRALELSTELDWQTDLFSWMDQGYAFSLLPSDDGEAIDWLIVARVRDQDRAAEQQLDEKVRSLGLQSFPVSLKDPNWGEAIAWVPASYVPPAVQPQQNSEDGSEQDLAQSRRIRTAQVQADDASEAGEILTPPGTDSIPSEATQPEIEEEPQLPLPALAYHVHYQDHFYLTTSLSALEQVLQKQPLAGTEVWERATAFLPQRNQGYLFVNIEEAMTWLVRILPQGSDPWQWFQLLQDADLGWPETITLVTTQTSPGSQSLPGGSVPLVHEGQMFIQFGRR